MVFIIAQIPRLEKWRRQFSKKKTQALPGRQALPDTAPVIFRYLRTLTMSKPSTFSPVAMQRLNWRSARASIQLMARRRGLPALSTITTV